MGKYEKRKGILPVPVRRKLQPDESNRRRRSARKRRWHGRYTPEIHAEVEYLRREAKNIREKIREQYPRYIPFEDWIEERMHQELEGALKAGFRTHMEGRKRECPRWWFSDRCDDAEMRRLWFKGYDLAKKTEDTRA